MTWTLLDRCNKKTRDKFPYNTCSHRICYSRRYIILSYNRWLRRYWTGTKMQDHVSLLFTSFYLPRAQFYSNCASPLISLLLITNRDPFSGETTRLKNLTLLPPPYIMVMKIYKYKTLEIILELDSFAWSDIVLDSKRNGPAPVLEGHD